MTSVEARARTLDLMRFIEAGPTAAHAIQAAVERLEGAGYTRRAEADGWNTAPGETFFVVRGFNSLIAVRTGSAPLAEAGFRIAGAHTDAPGFRLKPNAFYAESGYLQMGVEIYGGPLLSTWTDRDLTVAGKLFVRSPGAPPRAVLVKGDRPLCRIPQLAIHLNREVNTEGLILDKQKHLPPIFGLGKEQALAEKPLIRLLAEGAGLDPAEVVATELELIDVQPPAFGGLSEELYFAPRIDNLAGSHAVLEAFLAADAPGDATRVIALFDSEEIGSQTLAGAGSRFLDGVLERLASAGEAIHRALARSILVSVDGAHALHPNYADFHDPHHRPCLNGGPVIKVNAMQRYATSALTGHWFEACAGRAGIEIQHYVHRTDLPCGSTIGPMTAARLGVATIDVGNPMLSMHSIRETGGVADQLGMISVLAEHFTG